VTISGLGGEHGNRRGRGGEGRGGERLQ